MQVRDVELAAGRVRQHLVVLLQDLVEPHVVQVHVLLHGQEVVADGLGLLRLGVPGMQEGCFLFSGSALDGHSEWPRAWDDR